LLQFQQASLFVLRLLDVLVDVDLDVVVLLLQATLLRPLLLGLTSQLAELLLVALILGQFLQPIDGLVPLFFAGSCAL